MIFLGLEEPDSFVIDDIYVRWSETNVSAPLTLIVGKLSSMQLFYDQAKRADGRLENLDRLYKHSDVVLCGFDYTGKISKIGAEQESRVDFTAIFYDGVTAFVEQQIEDADVVIPAPLGTYFDKMSQRFASHFIRAEALLKTTTIIELLALRLLKPLNDWYSQSVGRATGAIDIFLDSMSVWPIGEKLAQLHKVGNVSNLTYRIESFKSYDGIENWRPQRRPAFVLISATTSGGLAHKVGAKIGFSNVEIWTVIALAPIESGDGLLPVELKCVYQLSRKLKGRASLDGLRDEFHTDMSTIPPGTETISIVSERFLSQPAKPKRVRLVHKALEDNTKKSLERIARTGLLRVARGRFDAQSRWSLSVDFAKLLDTVSTASKLGQESLLRNWLRNYSSPSPVAVIYPSSEGTSAQDVTEAASDFAKLTEAVLKEISPEAVIHRMSSDQLIRKESSFDLSQCSIVIVAPVLGNGFIFKQISALLRHKQPKGPRLFLALAVFPESQAHLTQLKNDISVALDDRSYEFKFQFAVPVGRLDNAIQWAQELQVLTELEDEMASQGIKAPAVSGRTRLLEQRKVLGDDQVFLPDSNEQPLFLSTGFFLWPGSVDIEGPQYGGAVLLSIAALLQAVRSSASKADETSLRTGLFQQALICPETFTRFNDSCIQAALLRAAYPAELNYTVSPEISHDMERLMLKWLQYYDQPAGAAVGEFLLALGTDKLKLRKKHLENVLNAAKKLSGWIGCLANVVERRLIGAQ